MRSYQFVAACGFALLGIGSALGGEDQDRDRFNDYLELREHERDLYHRGANRHRLSPWQRERLNQQLEYERKLDRQARRDYERSRRYRDEAFYEFREGPRYEVYRPHAGHGRRYWHER